MSRVFKGTTDVSASDGWIGSVNVYRLLEALDRWHEAHRLDYCGVNRNDATDKAFDQHEEKHAHVGAKYVRLDTGTSGAWMLEGETGDIFGIKGYGKVDRAKCAGSINDPSFNGAVLFKDRFRYGRFDNRKVQS